MSAAYRDVMLPILGNPYYARNRVFKLNISPRASFVKENNYVSYNTVRFSVLSGVRYAFKYSNVHHLNKFQFKRKIPRVLFSPSVIQSMAMKRK